jgi:hypothetical protein
MMLMLKQQCFPDENYFFLGSIHHPLEVGHVMKVRDSELILLGAKLNSLSNGKTLDEDDYLR